MDLEISICAAAFSSIVCCWKLFFSLLIFILYVGFMNSFYSLLSGSTQYSKKGKPVVCFCCYHKDEYYTYLLDSFYLALNWKRCSNNKHETRGVKSTKTHYRKLPVAYLHTQRSGDCNGKRSLITRSLQQQLRPTGVYRVNDDDVHPLGA